MKKCTYLLRHPDPRPNDQISGRLLSYRLKRGHIRVRYEPGTMGDFKRRGKLWVHPARCAGPYSIVIRGELGGMMLGMGANRAYLVALGENAGIAVFERGRPKPLARAIRPAGQQAVVVTVKQREISVATGGKVFLRAPRQSGNWGHFALDSKKFTSLVFDGLVDPSWLQSLIDAAEQKQLTAFESAYRAREHLPEWLFQDAPAPRYDEARRRAVSSPRLGKLMCMAECAARGPSWPRSYEHRSAHYHVFLFSGEAGCRRYLGELVGDLPPRFTGLYQPLLRQLVIWNLPTRDQMMRTIRHEGFHQTGANRAIFDRLWKACKTVRSPRRATEQALAGVDLNRLDADFRRHVALLRFRSSAGRTARARSGS